ncbi:F-box protein FBW2-like [Impatiens glandulifera]|uniref:F-box protein FBW2-like n=1 Tax=Impatiens glandulifera TaxID=253017 RepID=UPI001FB19CEE|nr:F-box protein FBW2-like [Impatiens glandulifera]
MEEQNVNHRRWDELAPDALGLIFGRLSLEELLMVMPSVCKSWENVVKGSYCWQEININDWCYDSTPEKIDRMVRMLINRSDGCMRKLSVSNLCGNAIISFIADNASSLQMLELVRCDMTDEVLELEAEKFSSVTSLDLSYSYQIGARSLLAMGNSCPQLTSLSRKMHPTDIQNEVGQDDEALAIANSMPNLRKLEISYLVVGTEAVMEIIQKCRNLELLDLKGCWETWIDHEELKLKFPNLKILEIKSDLDELYDSDSWDESNDEGDEFEENVVFFFFE